MVTVQSSASSRSTSSRSRSLSAVARFASTRPGAPFQRLVALVLLLLMAPLLLLLAAAVVLDSPGSPIYRQRRVGLGGKEFTLYKLRSMRPGSCHDGRPKCATDDRITRVGRFVRISSLDEVPQLWNVVRGDMALVGPRPLLAADTDDSPAYRRRVEVLPGMTGLWQVSGRCALDTEASLALDLQYVEERSTLLDLRILLRTPAAVLTGRGAY
jgi:lipopolysaccharide/colanic/teichoic acid biosynthesis glycosyltransferase